MGYFDVFDKAFVTIVAFFSDNKCIYNANEER